MKTKLAALLLAVPITAVSSPANARKAASIVRIETGQLQGVDQSGVISWKGIPFAAPPVGQNRWRAPQPAKAWRGVKKADLYGHDCMQVPFPSDAAPLGTTPNEDCLVLNVWRPAGTPSNRPLPVMVWIYGGGFVNGGSSPAVYSGDRLAQQGVIFVSFNYRLGRFGFFAHPALSAAKEGPLGNYGYLDQIAALKWVKRNIAAFGGDPRNVTVVGESAGGGSTLTLLTSPMAVGLVNRGIVMSGGGRGPLIAARRLNVTTAESKSAEEIGTNFAKLHGIAGTGPDDLARLRALPAAQVLDGLNMASMMARSGGLETYVGGPIEDGQIVVGSADRLIEAGKWANVPVLIGATSSDIGFSSAPTKAALFKEFGPNEADARAVYDPDNSQELPALVPQVAGDRMMVEPARHLAELVSKAGQRSFHYRFGYVAESMRREWGSGAPHATDIPWAFNTVQEKYGSALTDRDRNVAKLWSSYFVNFAKSGDPNGSGLPRWSAYEPSTKNVMFLMSDGRAHDGPDPWVSRLDVTAQATSSGRP